MSRPPRLASDTSSVADPVHVMRGCAGRRRSRLHPLRGRSRQLALAAPAHPAAALRAEPEVPPGYLLWVGGSAYGEAEAVLLAMMPSLAREAAGQADTAWR
jgi:hypothetical protein